MNSEILYFSEVFGPKYGTAGSVLISPFARDWLTSLIHKPHRGGLHS